MAHINDKKSLAQSIADELSAMILDGDKFQVGSRLPNEMELANLFGVSRTTLREAIRILTVRGFIEVRHGIGTFVVDYPPAPSDYGFRDLAHLKIDVRDLFEARLIFEPQVAALAVARATDAELEEIIVLEQKVQQAYHEGKDVSDLDRQFHNALIKCAHNPFLEEISTIINDGIKNLLMIIEVTEVQDVVAHDLKNIVEFVKRRDSIGVEGAMKVHILHSIHLLDSYDT